MRGVFGFGTSARTLSALSPAFAAIPDAAKGHGSVCKGACCGEEKCSERVLSEAPTEYRFRAISRPPFWLQTMARY